MSRQNKQAKKSQLRKQVTSAHLTSVKKLGVKRTKQNPTERVKMGAGIKPKVRKTIKDAVNS